MRCTHIHPFFKSKWKYSSLSSGAQFWEHRGESDTDLVLEDPAEDKCGWDEVTGNGGAILVLLSGSRMSRRRCSKLGGAQKTLRKVVKRI